MSRAVLVGIRASAGVAVAPAFVRADHAHIARRRVSDTRAEVSRLQRAIDSSRTELEVAAEAMRSRGSDAALVFDAHLLMHGDSMWVDAAVAQVEEAAMCAEWAIETVLDDLKKPLLASSSPYLRERAVDIEQVGRHIISALVGRNTDWPEEDCILVGWELSPAFATEILTRAQGPAVRGIVTERGSASSHTAILARALSVPALVGVRDATRAIENDQRLVVDALRGHVVVLPSEEEAEEAAVRGRAHAALQAQRTARVDQPVCTTDGVDVEVSANIELPAEAAHARAAGAAGVGLFRTEFLFLGRASLPDEDTQYDAYCRVLGDLAPAPVVFRALDLGGDKLPGHWATRGENPALGVRSLRLLLREPALFRVQLRALMRAAASTHPPSPANESAGQAVGPDAPSDVARLMLPLVSDLGELEKAKALIAEVAAELREEGAPFRQMTLGAMVEVPSMALMAGALSQRVAFLSVGTNDLTQYTLAADRGEPSLASFASPLHPSVLRLLGVIAEEATVPVNLCGDMAAEPHAIPILLGLGLTRLSVAVPLLPLTQEVVRQIDQRAAEALAARCLKADGVQAVKALVEEAFPSLCTFFGES